MEDGKCCSDDDWLDSGKIARSAIAGAALHSGGSEGCAGRFSDTWVWDKPAACCDWLAFFVCNSLSSLAPPERALLEGCAGAAEWKDYSSIIQKRNFDLMQPIALEDDCFFVR